MTNTELANRLRECADEVMEFPHPSHCDHLHDAAKLMREAADVLQSPPHPFAHARKWGQGSASMSACGCWTSDVDGVHQEYKCPAHAAGVSACDGESKQGKPY